ncbi:MAG: hypothetical protein V3V77_00725 [Candidatus Bipolaricaulota bacterium]
MRSVVWWRTEPIARISDEIPLASRIRVGSSVSRNPNALLNPPLSSRDMLDLAFVHCTSKRLPIFCFSYDP